MPEVEDTAVDCQQLSVEGTVAAFCRAQLLGEEPQRSPRLAAAAKQLLRENWRRL
jgi:hypothetical protein